VEKKPLISGVVSGFFGALAGSFAFVCSFYQLTNLLHSNLYKGQYPLLDKIKLWDWRLKNIAIYGVSDSIASIMKAPFEVRK
jgi:hypothetical protein